MFGFIRNVIQTAVDVVTVPLDIGEDLVNGEIAPRTEKKVDDISQDVANFFNPRKW